MQEIKVKAIFQEDGRLVIENLPGHKGEEAEVIIFLDKPIVILHEFLDADKIPPKERVPPCTEWPPGFFEEVIGGWQGEPMERPEQGEYEQRLEII